MRRWVVYGAPLVEIHQPANQLLWLHLVRTFVFQEMDSFFCFPFESSAKICSTYCVRKDAAWLNGTSTKF